MKNLCKLSSKDIEDNFKELAKLVKKSKYICAKCARSSNDKSVLCKPKTDITGFFRG
jgi:hypothetical protein